jgi:uncharacterized repeat protein (TIGR02543 family)
MRKQPIIFAILITMLCAMFLSCEGMATLFHGPKPEAPPVVYTVTFYANGASGSPPAAKTVTAGDVINLPAKEGLSKGSDIFAGWSEENGGTIYPPSASVTVNGNMAFYAQWLDSTTPQYTVTFDRNGATSGSPPSSQTAYSGMGIAIPNQGTLAYSGKTFGGWNTMQNGGGTNYTAGTIYPVTGDTTLYAKWQSEVQYTVTYNANGANGAVPTAQTVDPGTVITLPGVESLTYSERVFDGWNTQSNGGGTNYAAGASYTVNGNVTLYAKWNIEIKYTVTFIANGASGIAPAAQRVDPGAVISLPGVGSMTYTGRTFDGWNTNADGTGTNYTEGESYTVNANASLYARWVSAPITPPGATLVEQLAYIRNNAGDGVVYDIVVNNNEYIAPQTVATLGRNITVIIHSASSEDVKSIQLESQGYLFSVDTNITLKLQDIVLKGMSTNNVALVLVGQGGNLILNSGAKVTGNTNAFGDECGGGIRVNGGVLEVNGEAMITGNTVTYVYTYGGGIYVGNGGNVTIRGGLISENTVNSTGRVAFGGGVYITGNSTVTMSGGTISKNTATGYGNGGGGIYIENGSRFDKRAASGNSTSGIIYGGTGDNANTTRDGGGHAIRRAFGTLRNRNSTLGYYDEITTLSDEGWE